jgi:hypothetical protein
MIGLKFGRNDTPPIDRRVELNRQSPYANGLVALFPLFNPLVFFKNLAFPCTFTTAFTSSDDTHRVGPWGYQAAHDPASVGANLSVGDQASETDYPIKNMNAYRGTIAIRAYCDAAVSTQTEIVHALNGGGGDGINLMRDGFSGSRLRWAYKYDYTYPNVLVPSSGSGTTNWFTFVGTYEFQSTTVDLEGWVKEDTSTYIQTNSGSPAASIWDETDPQLLYFSRMGNTGNEVETIDFRWWDWVLPSGMIQGLFDPSTYWNLYTTPPDKFYSLPIGGLNINIAPDQSMIEVV